jgi:hypothetical protein
LNARSSSSDLQPNGSPELYLAVGSLARLQWIFWDVLMLEMESGLGVPLRHPRLIEGYEASAPVMAFASLGMGGRFP